MLDRVEKLIDSLVESDFDDVDWGYNQKDFDLEPGTRGAIWSDVEAAIISDIDGVMGTHLWWREENAMPLSQYLPDIIPGWWEQVYGQDAKVSIVMLKDWGPDRQSISELLDDLGFTVPVANLSGRAAERVVFMYKRALNMAIDGDAQLKALIDNWRVVWDETNLYVAMVRRRDHA